MQCAAYPFGRRRRLHASAGAASSALAALEVARGPLPDHRLAQHFRPGVAQDLELAAAQRSDLDAVLGVGIRIVNPAIIPLAAGNGLGVADDLDAAALRVLLVLDPDDT